jgi:hypothetical protein
MRRPGTTANAVPRLENQRTNRSLRKPGGRRHSGSPRADYDHIDFVHTRKHRCNGNKIWGHPTCIPRPPWTPA